MCWLHAFGRAVHLEKLRVKGRISNERQLHTRECSLVSLKGDSRHMDCGCLHSVKDFEGDFVGSSDLVSCKIGTSIKIFESCNLGSLRSGKICLQNPLCG
jgi:hypothetical protein